MRGGEGVQVARSEAALAALQQDGVLVSGDRIVVQFQADGGDARLGLQGRWVLGTEKLSARVHDLTADNALNSQVCVPADQDIQILQSRETDDRRNLRSVGAR